MKEELRITTAKKALLAGLEFKKYCTEKKMSEIWKDKKSKKDLTKKDLIRLENQRQTVAEVKRVIEKVKSHDFDGNLRCEECGKIISVEYLEDHLCTSLCEDCARKEREAEQKTR